MWVGFQTWTLKYWAATALNGVNSKFIRCRGSVPSPIKASDWFAW